jgi:polyhydroxyalkanoate synthase
VESVTFLTAMMDFSDTGDISCFIDETSVAAREATIGKGGLVPGRDLMNVFSSLRPNDLVWNYVVDNYLKGNKPSAFDILYWNSDSTNLSGPFAAWYLRNTYLENNLRVPGKVKVLGEPLDLGRIDCPAYFVATREDHIVPWRTSFLGRRLLGGESVFVLGASGHVAGVINPPAKNKRSYWTNALPTATADEWLDGAVEHRGSWWPNWIDWLKARSGELITAPAKAGNRRFKEIEPAPGRYVKERS